MRRAKWAFIGFLVVVSAGCALRPSLGRGRPDLAALMSFDGAPLTFDRTYTSGKVGPFTIGDSRRDTMERIAGSRPSDKDMELHGKPAAWSVALPAQSGGYNIYTLHFEGERLSSVKAFYSVFAGL
jgi:hypothetical protein